MPSVGPFLGPVISQQCSRANPNDEADPSYQIIITILLLAVVEGVEHTRACVCTCAGQRSSSGIAP